MVSPRRRSTRSRNRAAVLLFVAGLLVVGATGCSDEPEEPASSTGATTTTTPVLTPDAIPVLQAAEPIPAGTEAGDAAAAGMIEATTVARALFPVDGAVTLELIEGRVALTDIAEGTLLTLGMFGTPGENGSTPAGAGAESDEDG